MRYAISYTRFSTKKQEKGSSEWRQAEDFQKFCLAHNLTPYSETFIDKGKSGYKGHHREGDFGRFLALLEAGKIPQGSVLVVENLDRFSREVPDVAVGTWASIIRQGCDIGVCRSGNIRTKADLGTMAIVMDFMQMALAHEESDKKADRVKKSWNKRRQEAQATGKPLTSVCPRWLKRTASGFAFTDEAVKLRQAVHFAIGGLGATECRRKSGLTEWAGLGCMFRQRTLIGEYQPCDMSGKKIGEAIKNFYPALITEQDFYRLQASIDQRKNNNCKRSGDKITNLFTGLLFDSEGERLVVKRDGRGKANLITSKAAQGQGKYLAFDYDTAEFLLLCTFCELTPADLCKEQHTGERAKIDVLDGEIKKAESKIKTLQALMLSTDNASILAQSILDLQSQLEAFKSDRERLKGIVATSGVDWLEDGMELCRHLGGLQGDELKEARARLKSLLPSIFQRVEVSREGKNPCALRLKVWLVNGKAYQGKFCFWEKVKATA